MKKLKHMLSIMMALVLTVTSVMVIPVNAESNEDTIITVTITVQDEYNLAEDFYELLNQKRTESGKYEYILDSTLTEWAMERAAQCCIYFEHVTLSGDPKKTDALGDFQDKYNLNNIAMQEDIAEGVADAQSVYTVWYNSNGHRPLLTDTSNYKYCGVGVVTYHGQRKWVLIVSGAPVGNTIEKVSGSKTNTRTIKAKVKYFSRKKVAALDEWADNPFAFSDIESGKDGYYIQQAGIFTFKNNNPELIDIDSMGRLKPKANGKGTFTVYYKNIELCTVSVTAYHDEEEKVTPTPSPKPTEPPKQTETTKPTNTPAPTQPPKQTETITPIPSQSETVKPTQSPKQTEGKTDIIGPADEETNDDIGGNNQTGTQTEPETKNPPKQTETVKPVSHKLTIKTKNVTYNGKAQKPAVTVYAGNKKLSSKYYTVSYKNNKNVGYGSIVVRGKGSYRKYSGTATFKINLKKTKLSSAKSTKKKTFTTTWKKTGGNSGWQVQYSTNKKFRTSVRTVNLKSRNTKLTVRKLKSRKTYYIRVRGYKKVNGKIMYSGWSNVKKVKVK